MAKISVVIPIYNTEKYLSKCLDSIISQTLSDIEIICINDASTDASLEILQTYASKDKRIKIIDFKENKGVAIARNTGIDNAVGKYIGFIDSDDYIDADFYEKLYAKAMQTGADIVKGAYKNYPSGYTDTDINIKIKEEKTNFCSTYCSAIFKMDFIRKNHLAFPPLKDMEDPVFAFSAALLANKIEVIDNLYVTITKREDSITGKTPTLETIKEKIKGLDLIVSLANSSNLSSSSYAYVTGFWLSIVALNSFYNKIQSVCDYATNGIFEIYKKIKYKDELKNTTEKILPGLVDYLNNYNKCQNLQTLKEEINKHDIISFDIFDTLLIRPFLHPVDLFAHIGTINGKPKFFQERQLAERTQRTRMKIKNGFEDINYDEIYANIKPEYQYLKEQELNFEYHTLIVDKTMFEIYQYALNQGKKIIITSDMYLKEDFLKKLLEDKGYKGFSKLFVSSKIRQCKASGNLYTYILDELGAEPSNILHIGDNFYSDYQKAMEKGLHAFWYKGLRETYINSFTNIKDKRFIEQNRNSKENILFGIQALNCENKKNENYWYNLGYLYGGPLVFAFTSAIDTTQRQRGITDLFFTARDAFVLKEAYEIIRGKNTTETHYAKTHYIYAQRKIKSKCFLKENNPDYSAQTEREYIKYINSLPLKGNNIAIVDSCAGNFTAQSLIEKYLPNKIFVGIYLIANTNYKYNHINLLKQTGGTVKFNWNLGELFLTSTEAPVIDIKDKKPVYDKTPDKEELIRQKIYSKIYEGEIDFIKDYIKYFRFNEEYEPETLLEYAHDLISNYWTNLNNIDREMLSKIKHPMDIHSTKYLSLLVDPSNEFKIRKGIYKC